MTRAASDVVLVDAPPETDPTIWPEPVDIMRELAAPPFVGDELPEAFGAYPRAYAKATGLDLGMALSGALGVAAAALSDQIQIVADSHTKWFQQPRLWMLHIARPGWGKTPLQKHLLDPLWVLQRELAAEHAKYIGELKDDERPPPLPRIVLADTTIEALSEVLRNQERGILIANDEFESWLGSLDAYRRGGVSRDRGEWLRLFDGGPHSIERVQRGSVFVPNWGASILTATTPAALLKLTRELPEDGLLQRFIPIIGTSLGEPCDQGSSIEPLHDRYALMLRRLYETVPRAHGGCVPLSIAAKEYLRTWQKEQRLMAEAFGAIEPALEAHFSKYPNFLLRVALTLHAAQIVMNDAVQARDPAAFPVPVETMRMAAKFLNRASLHATALYLGRDGNEVHALARDLGRSIIARGWERVARRDLIASVRAFRKAEPHAQDAVLRFLVDLGWIRRSETGYSKATPTRYEVNPALKPKFARLADRERERRAIVRDMISEAAHDRRSEPPEGGQ